MAQSQVLTKSIALIHSSSLPGHLGILSTIIASDCQTCYCLKPNLTIRALDLADYYLPSISSSSTLTLTFTTTISLKPLSEWQDEITQCTGIILLFPYHIWSYCNIIKLALSDTIFPPTTHPRAITSKPVLLVGFGKEDLWRANKPGTDEGYTQRIWSRKSFAMMREWGIERGMKPIPPQVFGSGETAEEAWPEFNCYDDYWRTWEKTGEVVIGGQQSERWEGAGWDRCMTGMGKMLEMLEGSKVR